GGGGGGSSSFGGGGSGTTSGGGAWIVLLVLGFVLATFLFGLWKVRQLRKKRRARDAAVRLASAEAADDDAYFHHEAVEQEATALFLAVQQAWSTNDVAQLHTMVGADLMVEWERRLRDFESKGWRNVCHVHNAPELKYVGLVNREDDTEDRVTVHLSATMDDYVEDRNGNKIEHNESSSTQRLLEEYWTLARHGSGERWTLVSIEADAEGHHHLDAEIVASPWSDSRLHDESLAEVAAADGAANGDANVFELASFDYADDAHAAALDLSLVDARFGPDVLEAAARRALAGWAEAVDGEDTALEAVATPEAIAALLYPEGGDTHRIVVRGPRLESIRITALDGKGTPPTMDVTAQVRGRRYVENRDTAAVVSGSKSSETSFPVSLRMALDGDGPAAWRVVAAGSAATA
ncbi:MAG: TIM44-like domain-containing protein, partial [Solirubrobacteraceae bacterium]|nr:TIM44-like domain-containing protein [Solirubrobacteraceae bacterium]